MKKEERLGLLKNKKQTFALEINVGLSIMLTFLAVATPITASTIISFNNNKITLFMLALFIITGFFTLKKPLINLHENAKKIRKIDCLIYKIIRNKDIEEIIINEYCK
jgi:uncharacterized membrane protein